MLTQESLKRTPLYDEHVALKASMVPFGGWQMPVQYEGILAEYTQTRQAATLFDTSHMGEFLIEGDCEKTGFEHIVTMRLNDMPLKTSRYGMLLNEQGGVIDDLIVFRIARDQWFCVVNGGTIDKDARHIKEKLRPSAKFSNISMDLGKLDLQGPLSRDILKQYIPTIEKLNYFAFDYFDLLGENVLVSRTGYTGELGYEIFFPWDKIVDCWRTLLTHKEVKPAGLGARDVLRLEMGYSLYGHELSDTITPLEAGLSRFVDFEKDFIGKPALLTQKEQGIPRRLIGFTSTSRKSPRADNPLWSADKKMIGTVTSGSFSPAVGTGIGLGLIASAASEANFAKGAKIFFGEENNFNEAVISERIFYKKGSLKH
jgi:aminomethyltransferase